MRKHAEEEGRQRLEDAPGATRSWRRREAPSLAASLAAPLAAPLAAVENTPCPRRFQNLDRPGQGEKFLLFTPVCGPCHSSPRDSHAVLCFQGK